MQFSLKVKQKQMNITAPFTKINYGLFPLVTPREKCYDIATVGCIRQHIQNDAITG